METFIDRLQATKKVRKISNEKIAEKLGLSPSVVTNYFSGRTEIPVSVIVKLCAVLGTSVDYILTGTIVEGQTMVQEPGVEYGLKNLKTPPDEALRASVEALISMYHRIELLTKKTNVLELEMSEMKTKKA